jgi:beta-galactosidase
MTLRLAAAATLCAAILHADLSVQDFNAGWRFKKDPEGKLDASAAVFDDTAWQAVRLPHDWAISGPFDPEGDGGTGKLPWRGVGWYRKTFTLPALSAGTRVYLNFDGVMADPEVYVNGRKAGGWDYGYIGFRVDATPFAVPGQANTVAVKADTRSHHSRWYPGAGIYRKVALSLRDPVHVAHEATFVTTPEVSPAQAAVQVETAVTNASDQGIMAVVTIALIGPAGNIVDESTRTFIAGRHLNVPLKHRFTLAGPALWDMDAPNLYTAKVTVRRYTTKETGKLPPVTDTESVRFGIRTFSFPADDGFHLNGRRVQLNGVDLHSDLGPLGMAFNRSAMRRQLEIMKDMGCNALRTSHNCPAPEVLDLCDELGLFVWNEAFDKWDGTAGRRNDQNLEEYIARNLRQFVRRDRNHPCVFVWSIGNEIPPAKPDNPGDPGMTGTRCARFRDVIRELDATRPVGIGCCHADAIGMGIFDSLDLTGWNYREQYTAMKAKYPRKPVLYSESASALSSYGFYAVPPPQDKTDYAVDAREVCSYDHNAAPWSDIPDLEFARMARDRYCGGEFVWTGVDYLGEPTPYGYGIVKGVPNRELSRSSYFGIVDLTGIPKDRFYLYRSHWNKNDATLHILPHWNWAGREGQTVPVYVYTSGDSAELFLNGKSLGRRAKGQPQDRARVVNLAAGKPATASSVETAAHHNPAEHAVDGKTETRWCAAGAAKEQWWQVDLGAPTAFRYITVAFENPDARAYGYAVLVSDDARSWRTLFSKKCGEPTAPGALGAPVTCRYVRVAFNDLRKECWASIREFSLTTEQPANPYYDVCDRYRLRWLDVAYQPGELKAVAYRDGRKIGERVMRTVGPAVAVKLTPENGGRAWAGHAVSASAGRGQASSNLPEGGATDGDDLIFVQIDATDAQGTRDPLAAHRIRFSLAGPGEIVAVGNGNARGYDAFTDTAGHPLYFGKAVAVLRRTGTGEVALTASADGLQPATATFSR